MVAIALVLAKTGHSQTVDCDFVFTELERAICANSELDKLDQELEKLLTQAVSENSLTVGAVREIRNQLALRCGASEDVAECLIAREREMIAQLSQPTRQVVEVTASYRPSSVMDESYESLKLILTEAENLAPEDSYVDNVVAPTLALLELFRSDGASHLSDEMRVYEVQALESRLRAGCRDLRQARYWQRELQAHGRSCDETPSNP